MSLSKADPKTSPQELVDEFVRKELRDILRLDLGPFRAVEPGRKDLGEMRDDELEKKKLRCASRPCISPTSSDVLLTFWSGRQEDERGRNDTLPRLGEDDGQYTAHESGL